MCVDGGRSGLLKPQRDAVYGLGTPKAMVANDVQQPLVNRAALVGQGPPMGFLGNADEMNEPKADQSEDDER